ncbi:MAG: radical SAM protein [Spirochaetales bacterium]|nr:radical SAM protein [Spirochaetales bacterium]
MSDEQYQGYELGPIRPPSEAGSLLLRITRNCPWNKCRFCGLYKGEGFSARSVEHIKRDIDQIKSWTDYFRTKAAGTDAIRPENEGSMALSMAENWTHSGMRSIFLQDANSLVIKPEHMIEILTYLRLNFPDTERITSYARSQTISRISDEDLSAIAAAGLNRIHIGLESGCDAVLDLVRKGADKKTHIIAGQKVKKAKIELSEYFMPGLGGKEYSHQNAVETADALNQINPDFIRIRTLAIPDSLEITSDYRNGISTRTNDVEMAEELLLLIQNLVGITSFLKNDHILNLFPEVQGRFPEDKANMLAVIEKFLSLPEEDQMIFRIGRRTGTMVLLKGLENEDKRAPIQRIIEQNDINKDSIDEICDELMKRFI